MISNTPDEILERIASSGPIMALVGPTAVGKTSLSLELASRTSAEIISIDSRQIYRELTIGSAKPSHDELDTVKHHFINERSLTESLTAAEFAESARQRIVDIRDRQKQVILTGGSTLYIHALLFGLDDVPPSDPEIRSTLESILRANGLQPLLDELRRVDRVAAEQIDLSNPRRVVRALEVYRATGEPISEFWARQSSAHRRERFKIAVSEVFVLTRPRDVLYDRINRRVDRMYSAGLVEEVKAILETGVAPALQALQTIGYRETIQYLERKLSRSEMIDLVKRNSRRYAKRQLTWFRRYETLQWIDLGGSVTSSA